jgi:CheY-like chemotaxis protein
VTPPSNAPRILVVEDDPEMIAAVSAVLGTAGYEVVEAANGRSALEISRSQRVDLILLDLGLPGVNGLDVARSLRDERPISGIPIVALSGSWIADDAESLRSVGITAGLRKPFGAADLLSLVASVLTSRSQAARRGRDVLALGQDAETAEA